MLDNSWHEDAAKTTRVLQIIVAALTAGTFFFLVIALAIRASLAKPPGLSMPISLTAIAVVVAAGSLVARQFVVRAVVSKGRRQIANGAYRPAAPQQTGDGIGTPRGDAQCLLQVFTTKTIISAAMFEGVAFFATIVFLLEGSPVSLGLAILLILAVAMHFPTRSHIINWVDRQTETIEQEKMLR